MLHVQGAWSINDNKTEATFHAADNPTQNELLACIDKIAAGTIKILKRMNLVEQGSDGIDVVTNNEDQDTLANILQSAFGRRELRTQFFEILQHPLVDQKA
jgi:hypothetical protein